MIDNLKKGGDLIANRNIDLMCAKTCLIEGSLPQAVTGFEHLEPECGRKHYRYKPYDRDFDNRDLLD